MSWERDLTRHNEKMALGYDPTNEEPYPAVREGKKGNPNSFALRQEFTSTTWVLGADGLYVNPKADPNCTTCRGHGVVDSGNDYGCFLINCSNCWR